MPKLGEELTKARGGNPADGRCEEGFCPNWATHVATDNVQGGKTARLCGKHAKGLQRAIGDKYIDVRPIKKTLGSVIGLEKKKEQPATASSVSSVPGHEGAHIVQSPSDEHHFHIIHPYGTDVIDLHHEGGNAYRSGRFSPAKPAKDHADAAKQILDGRKREFDQQASARAAVEHERKHGNEYTGDISGLHQHMHVHSVKDNYVEGSTKDGSHKITAQVFSEPSTFGIAGGRISRLSVRSPYGDEHVNYDRGWDRRPATPEHKELVRNLVRSTRSASPLAGVSAAEAKIKKGDISDEDLFGGEIEAPALVDTRAVAKSAEIDDDDPPELQKAASNGHKIPGLTGWSMHAGGTGAAEGKHGYTHTAPGGHLNQGGENFTTYSIDPISNERGRHLGYRASVAGHPNNTGLHNQITEGGQHNGHFMGRLFSSPGSAAKACREHYNRHLQTDAPGCETCAVLRRPDPPA